MDDSRFVRLNAATFAWAAMLVLCGRSLTRAQEIASWITLGLAVCTFVASSFDERTLLIATVLAFTIDVLAMAFEDVDPLNAAIRGIAVAAILVVLIVFFCVARRF